jgi:hypothetical protein
VRVKLTMRIDPGLTDSRESNQATRAQATAVLPVPGPASTKNLAAMGASMMTFCSEVQFK